jgi:hypothetical protein
MIPISNPAFNAPPDKHEQLVQDAWIGDAVLSLWARLKILQEDGELDGSKLIRLTSNRFLATVGEPTKVEAEIGKVYRAEGLDAANRYIESRLLPSFIRQEQNRLVRKPVRPRKAGRSLESIQRR